MSKKIAKYEKENTLHTERKKAAEKATAAAEVEKKLAAFAYISHHILQMIHRIVLSQ